MHSGAQQQEPAAGSLPTVAPATFYTVQGGNDTFWRADAPAQAIGANLCVIPEDQAEKIIGWPQDEGPFQWRINENEDGCDYPAHEGAAVWIRPDPHRAFHAGFMREHGILTISEVDDNYLSNPKLNLFQRMQKFGPAGQMAHLKSMASMDRIVFSTEWLRDYYLKKFRKVLRIPKRQMPEPFICRNNIDQAQWPEPIPRGNSPLRVGWMGSPSHIWDVDLAWNALLHASRKGCETYMIGYDPTDPDQGMTPDEMRSDRSKMKIAQWGKVGFKHIPWTKPDAYHRAALPLDIGLAPLLDNLYTRGKSDVKFLEYTIAGAATIAQNTIIYQKTIRHMENGILVGSPREMMEAVDLLIRDPALREELVANARRYVLEERGLKQLREEWLAAVTP